MSTSIDNFTVTEVNRTVALGGTIPSTVLTLSPNAGYTIDAAAFTATITSPVSSVVFSQSGADVLMSIGFDGTEVTGDLSVPICMSGSSSTVVISLQVDYVHTLQNATASLAPTTINISGPYNTTSSVFTSTFTADTDFYFLNTPTCVVTVGNANSYTLSNNKTFDSNNNLIAISFSAEYTFPTTSVTGNEIKVIASAVALPDVAPIEVRSYNFTNTPFSTAGETRRFIATGTPGAAWNLTVTGGATPSFYASTIPSGGQDFIDIVVPPAFNTSYVFTLSGDLITPFPQVNPFTISQAGDIATLSTVLVTNITTTDATSGGSNIITSDTVTQKGVQWSTASDFGVVIGFTTEGAGNTDFVSSITGLSASTNYFIRAYATNSAGTGYGQVLQFATGSVPLKSIAGGSYTSSSLACGSTDTLNIFYFEGNIIEAGATVYTDSGLLNTFVGDNGWYRVDSQDATRSMQINSSGEVGLFITLCNP